MEYSVFSCSPFPLIMFTLLYNSLCYNALDNRISTPKKEVIQMEVLLKTPFAQKRFKYSLIMAGVSIIISLLFSIGVYYRVEDNNFVTNRLPDSILDNDAPEYPNGNISNNGSNTQNPPTNEQLPFPPQTDISINPTTIDENSSLSPEVNVPNYLTGILVSADMRVGVARRATVGILASGLTLIITFLSSFIFYRMLSSERDDLSDIERYAIVHHRSWEGRIIIGFTAGCIFMVISWFGWIIFGMMFSNLWLSHIAAVVVTVAYCAIFGFAATYWIIALRTMDIVTLGLVTFALGLFGSFLLSSDPQWWQVSLSYLGYDSGADIIFRVSLMAVGLMLLIVARDLSDIFAIEVQMGLLSKRNYRIVRLGALLICFGIAGVGIFPVRVSELSTNLHNLSVYTAGATFGLGMLLIRWITPNLFHESFYKLTWGLLAICISFVFMRIVGIINFVALEILSFAIFSIWLYLLNEYTLHHLSLQNVENVKLATQTIRAIPD